MWMLAPDGVRANNIIRAKTKLGGDAMAESKLQANIDALREFVQRNGGSILKEREIQNGFQLLVTDGITRVTIDCYTNGNAFIQGAAGSLKTDLQNWWKQQRASPASPLLETAELSTMVRAIVEMFRAFAVSQGWTPAGRMIHNGIYQLRLTSGSITVPINVYPTGTVLIQGNPSEMRSIIEQWWQQQQIPSGLWEQAPPSVEQLSKQTSMPSSSSLLETAVGAHIGLDEAGKGDYFGPLVIGAVYVDEQTEPRLIELGVRDSKLLTDSRILALAEKIKALCPHFVVPIEPKRYNELYNKIHHLNRLLAWGHAWTLEQMLEKVPANLAIIDQFGDKSYILQALREKGRSITIVQRPRAEEDVAVAAASILARARFVQQLEQLSKRVGTTLPKGASDPAIVAVGREIVAKFGKDILTEVAKLHFKTTQAILQTG
jgi:ribonuclease HIII